jgi:hypothetical protein
MRSGGSLGAVTRLTLRTRALPDFFGAVQTTTRATSDGRSSTPWRQAEPIARAMTEIRKLPPDGGRPPSGRGSPLRHLLWRPYQAALRLLAVKKAYYLDGLFFVHHGVGSERWSADGFTRRPG